MRNVVVLCLDTVRKDYFDEYAPRMRERSDVIYSQARAASCWSVPSHASMLTGTLPSEHGVHAHNLDYTGIEGETILSDLNGYETIGISANGYANSDFGFDMLFDQFRDVEYGSSEIFGRSIEELLFDQTPLPHLRDNGTKSCLKELTAQIGSTNGPFLAFVNLMEAHTPHHHVLGYDRDLHSVPNRWSWMETPREQVVRNPKEHEQYLQNYRELYAASIDYLDRHVSATIDRIQNSTTEPVTFVITADHGENLGRESDEHQFSHTSSLSEGVLHVPLTIVNPPADTPVETDSFVSHLQLPDLIAGFAAGEVPDISRGKIQAEVVGHAISSSPT